MLDQKKKGRVFYDWTKNLREGLEEAFRAVYPKADVQRCVVHKVRNTLSCVRKKDQFEVAEDFKLIYRAPNKEMALQMFQQFESKWSSKYPREVQSWANELDALLTFMDYPSSSSKCDLYDQCHRTNDQGDSETPKADEQFEQFRSR